MSMQTIIENKDMIWLDINSPKEKEVEALSEKYSIHPLVSEELLKPTLHPKVDDYFDMLYLVLHFPIFEEEKKASTTREIDFIIGKNFVITAHYEPIEPFQKFIKKIQKDKSFKTRHPSNHSGFLIFHILRYLYGFSLRELDHIQKKIDILENKLFEGAEEEMVKKISLLERDILNFRRTLKPHESVLNSLSTSGKLFFGDNFAPYLNNISGQYFKLLNILENNIWTIEALGKTNESLLSTRTNEIMKFLTIMAFTTFPLSLIASIFSMNTKILPIVGKENDFWFIIGIMATISFVFFLFFKARKWI